MITHSLAVSFLFSLLFTLLATTNPPFSPLKSVWPPPPSLKKFSLVAKTKDSRYVKEGNKFERSFQISTLYGAKTETDRQIKEECLSVLSYTNIHEKNTTEIVSLVTKVFIFYYGAVRDL